MKCGPLEAAYFNPPAGQTCAQFAGDFVTSVGRGYLTNPEATTACGYCQFKDGTEYMRSLNYEPSDKWKYLPIFLAFCISNWALVYFFIYTVRVRHWGFGLGYIFGPLGKGVDAVEAGIKKLIHSKKTTEKQ